MYSQQNDFPAYISQPKKIIYLYFIPRSGSNFLAAEMRKTGKLGYPLEYFSLSHIMFWSKRFAKQGDKDMIASLIRARTSPNGVFGFKWNAWFDLKFRQRFDESPCQKYNIFIDRRDRVRQAESFFIAKKYNDWMNSRNKYPEKVSKRDLEENISLLDKLRDDTFELIRNDMRDDNREVFLIRYEELILDIGDVIKNILDFVGE